MLSLLLSACMMLNLAPMTAFASEQQAEIIVDEASAEGAETSTQAPETPDIEETTQDTPTDGTATDAQDVINTDDLVPEEAVDEPSEETTDESSEKTKDDIAADKEKELLLTEKKAKELLGDEDIKKYNYFDVDETGALKIKEGFSKDELPDVITLDMITEAGTVTKLGDIFAGTHITAITLPKTISEFGEGAFNACTSLTTVAFEDNTTDATVIPTRMFLGCTNLRWAGSSVYFTIPSGITTIGEDAFDRCTGLQGIVFASSVQTISANAFRGCTSLKKFEGIESSSLTTIGQYAFENTLIDGKDVKFPKTLTNIEKYAFSNCARIGNLDLSTTSITTEGLEGKCFANSGLTGIKFPSTYKVLPTEIFENCASLTEVTVGADKEGEGITTISKGAFTDCANLKKVTIKNSVQTVEDNAFVNCNAITDIYIEQHDANSNLTSIKLTADSFPTHDRLTIHSYSGTGEEWAGSHRADGVKYATLFAGKNVKTNTQVGGNTFTATPFVNVSVGTKVTLKDTAGSGYYLISLTHGPKKTDRLPEKDFVDSTKTFIVQSSDINSDNVIEADAAFANVSKDEFEFVDAADDKKIVLSGNDFEVTYATASQIKQLLIKVKTKDYGTVYSNPWLWNFDSSDRSIATVDADGKLKLLKKTPNNREVYITATLKANQNLKLKLKLKVKEETEFDHINGVTFDNTYKFEQGTDTDAGLPYMQTSKAWVEAGSINKLTRDFKVKVNAVNMNDEAIESNFKWTSGNTAIAKVDKATTDCNENIIKICGIGETTITATSTVDNTKSVSFIVRVIDKTPYVADSTITVNAPSTALYSNNRISKGVDFSLIQSYGGVISKDHIEVVKKVGSKYVSLEKDIVVEKSGDVENNIQKMKVAISDDSDYYKKNASYTNLFLKLSVDGDYYYVALPKFTVVNKMPTPSIAKRTGKINKFYTNNAKEQENVTIEIKTPAGYAFDTSEPLKLESLESDKEKNFEKNFTVEKASDSNDYSKIVIKQKPTTLITNSKNQVITSGYLCLKYNGYDTCKLKLTVPVSHIAPKLALEKTSVTTHKFAVGQSYELGLYDKTAKKNIDIDDEFTSVEYTINSNDYFDNLRPYFDKTNDKIVVSLDTRHSLSSTAKAYIKISNSTWAEDMVFPLTVVSSGAKPGVVRGNDGLINLNLAATDTNYIPFEIKGDFMDQNSLEFGPNPFEAKGSGRTKENADKITVKYDDGKIVAKIDPKNKPASGTYSFTSHYTMSYMGTGYERFEGNLTVRVKIYETKPILAPKTTTTKLNNVLVGLVDASGNAEETAVIPYTVRNTAAGAENAINTDFTVTDITNSRYPVSYKPEESPVAFNFENGEIKIYLREAISKNRRFKLSGLKVDGVATKDLTFTVNKISAEPVVTLRSDNKKINVLESNTAVTYTVNIKNFNGTVDASKFVLSRQSSGGTNNSTWEEDTSKFHFMIADQKDNTFKLVANPSYAGQIENRNYIYKGHYTFGTKMRGSSDSTRDSVEVRLATKPIQTMPKITQDKKTATLYIGNKNKVDTVKVTPVKGSSAEISGIAWDKSVSANIKKAFAEPTYDTATNKMTIKIKNAALLKKNTSYNLTFNIKCDGQLNNTVGTKFSVRVTVR